MSRNQRFFFNGLLVAAFVVAAASLFACYCEGASEAVEEDEDSTVLIQDLVRHPLQLCRTNTGQYVSCTPGGNGNLVCAAACGLGAVCLSIDQFSHGRCHVPGTQNP